MILERLQVELLSKKGRVSFMPLWWAEWAQYKSLAPNFLSSSVSGLMV